LRHEQDRYGREGIKSVELIHDSDRYKLQEIEKAIDCLLSN